MRQADYRLQHRLAAVEFACGFILLADQVLADVAVAAVAQNPVRHHDQQFAAGLQQLQTAVDRQHRRVHAVDRLPHALVVRLGPEASLVGIDAHHAVFDPLHEGIENSRASRAADRLVLTSLV